MKPIALNNDPFLNLPTQAEHSRTLYFEADGAVKLVFKKQVQINGQWVPHPTDPEKLIIFPVVADPEGEGYNADVATLIAAIETFITADCTKTAFGE